MNILWIHFLYTLPCRHSGGNSFPRRAVKGRVTLPMRNIFIAVVAGFFFIPLVPAHAATWQEPRSPSYVPGYGRLVYDAPHVAVYDNTGQYSPATARYRSRRNVPQTHAAAEETQRSFAGRRHCAFRPEQHIPKCYVYDDCTYEELYGDGFWPQCSYGARDDVRYHREYGDQRELLYEGPRNRSRPYPLYVRDNEEYGNSFLHYDSYWEDDGYRMENTYEWYDY